MIRYSKFYRLGGVCGEDGGILEKLLKFYEAYFDIERQFPSGGVTYDAYAHCSVTSTKYVLTQEAQLWRAYTFEHVFFCESDAFGGGELLEYEHRLREHLEPEFVRKGEKYPVPDHMCTYLTSVYICRKRVVRDVARRIRRHRYRRYYRFALRGYCEARLAVLDLESGEIYGNPAARQTVKRYKKILYQELHQEGRA